MLFASLLVQIDTAARAANGAVPEFVPLTEEEVRSLPSSFQWDAMQNMPNLACCACCTWISVRWSAWLHMTC